MSYPQPSADQYALNAQQAFRLVTQMVSPGDIYEVTQSGYAFAVGPDSDVADIKITYYDAQSAQQFVNQVSISPSRAFAGYIVAQNDATYMPANRPGVILMWAGNLIPSNGFLPTGFNPDQDRIVMEYPILDVVQSFQPTASVTSSRPDKTWFYQEVVIGNTSGYVLIPYYGRKYAAVQLDNNSGHDVNFTVTGINFKISDTAPATYATLGTALVVTTANTMQIYRADTVGLFDYLMIHVTPTVVATGITLKVITSDADGCAAGGT